MTCIVHKPVGGFGGMGDSMVCAKCGIDKYPEAFPLNRLPTITEDHPEYGVWKTKAIAARDIRAAVEAKLDKAR